MSRTALLAVVCSAAFLASARAADFWIIHGQASTPRQHGVVTRWEAFAILHNVSGANVAVRLAGGSEGTFTDPVSVTIAGGTSRTSHFGGLSGHRSANALWVSRLDVPEGVRVEGRLELWYDELFVGRPPPIAPLAKLSMPVFDRLARAGEEQLHFGTDVGGRRSRLNVAIYNGGTVAASARITLVEPLCAMTLDRGGRC